MSEPRERTRLQDPKRAHEQLRSIVEGTAAKTGRDFFRSLVRHLAVALDARCALVAELKPAESERVRTLAVWVGAFQENFEYDLVGTPCENVVNQTMCLYPRDIQRVFPNDQLLVDMGAESYLGVPLFDSSGGALGLLSVLDDRPMDEDPHARDLLAIFASRAAVELERKRAEEALRQNEERIRLIIETSLDAVITIDANGVITGWNARAEAIFGWSEHEAMGREMAELIIPPRYREAHRRGLRRFRATGEGPLLGRRVEISGLHRSGREFPTELSIATMHTEDSHEFSAFVHDITERREAEEERRKLEAQIQHAQRLESLGILAGGIAHDFNNLLTGILGNAGTARRKLASDHPAQQDLSEVVQGSKIASHLTGQLLAYAGKRQLHTRSLDLSAEVRGLEALLAASVRGKARLVLDLTDNLPPVEVDPVQVQQVLMNLVLNAAESSEDQVCIRIGAHAIDLGTEDLPTLVAGSGIQAGRYVALVVEDNGGGMDEATRERIFDPFFTTKTTGRGLGLAAMLGIAHGHGGGVSLESRPGTGTTFRVFFPISEEEVEPIPERPSGDLRCPTILVVDDDPYVLRVVCCALEAFGYSVISADDGSKAVDLFLEGEGEIDLVILDVSMPGMGGDETLRSLRAIRSDVKVLLSTGYDKDEGARPLPADAVTGFLRKPYDPGDLVAAVKRLLGGGDGARPSADLEPELEVVRADYTRRLPAKLEDLTLTLRAAHASADSRQALGRARQLAHQLRGTTGCYGLEQVTAALDLVDRTLHGMQENTASESERDWATMEDALARARASLE